MKAKTRNSQGRGIIFSVVLPPELYNKLVEMKEQYGIHLSEFIRIAVLEKLREMENQRKQILDEEGKTKQ